VARSQGLSRTSRGSETRVDVPKHELKSWPAFFEAILAGEKTHELRRGDDRTFNVGDVLLLREFDPKFSRYSGRELRVKVTYVTSTKNPCALSETSLHPDFCILSIKKL
jgi:hypothetical protein